MSNEDCPYAPRLTPHAGVQRLASRRSRYLQAPPATAVMNARYADLRVGRRLDAWGTSLGPGTPCSSRPRGVGAHARRIGVGVPFGANSPAQVRSFTPAVARCLVVVDVLVGGDARA